ncbi:MAG: GNAT family protein [Thermoleophilaceae bacterium]
MIEGDRIRLRPLRDDDAQALLEILTEPSVAEWWGTFDLERVRRELFDGCWFAVEESGRLAGLIGYSEEDDPEYRHAGIDVTLHPDFQNRGLGTDAVRTMARWLIEARGHVRITIDPAAGNARAIRCYERVGFKPVGVMRRYERLEGREPRDGLLMDLLPEELGHRP